MGMKTETKRLYQALLRDFNRKYGRPLTRRDRDCLRELLEMHTSDDPADKREARIIASLLVQLADFGNVNLTQIFGANIQDVVRKEAEGAKHPVEAARDIIREANAQSRH
jgi:hypothetical protein